MDARLFWITSAEAHFRAKNRTLSTSSHNMQPFGYIFSVLSIDATCCGINKTEIYGFISQVLDCRFARASGSDSEHHGSGDGDSGFFVRTFGRSWSTTRSVVSDS